MTRRKPTARTKERAMMVLIPAEGMVGERQRQLPDRDQARARERWPDDAQDGGDYSSGHLCGCEMLLAQGVCGPESTGGRGGSEKSGDGGRGVHRAELARGQKAYECRA